MNAFSAGKRHYDAVNMIHDVIRTADPFLYTAKFMFKIELKVKQIPTETLL